MPQNPARGVMWSTKADFDRCERSQELPCSASSNSGPILHGIVVCDRSNKVV
jgi:hypothetical protein